MFWAKYIHFLRETFSRHCLLTGRREKCRENAHLHPMDLKGVKRYWIVFLTLMVENLFNSVLKNRTEIMGCWNKREKSLVQFQIALKRQWIFYFLGIKVSHNTIYSLTMGWGVRRQMTWIFAPIARVVSVEFIQET